MRSISIDNSTPPRLRPNLGSILAIGFGASVAIHLGVIVAISRWLQPKVATEDPIDITLVAPIENPAPVKRPPTIAISPQPLPTPTPKVLAPVPQPPPISTPKILAPVPQPTSTATPTIRSITKPPIAIAANSTPKPLKLKPKSKLKSVALKPAQKAIRVAIAPKSTQTSPPPFTLPDATASSPPQTPISLPAAPPKVKVKSTPTPTRSIAQPQLGRIEPPSSSQQPPPQTIAPNTTFSTPAPAAPLPTPAATPANLPPLLDRVIPNSDRPKSGSRNSDRPPNNLPPNNSSQTRMSSESTPASGGQKERATSEDGQGNSTAQNTANAPIGKTGGTKNGTSAGNGTENGTSATNSNAGGAGNAAGVSGLQCVRNCQIARLQNLQDSDGGKDRLRIRISIDANGVVSAAEIAKSSGNSQIDAVVLEGIKQMQFNPTGKPIKGIIKANILL